MFSSPIRAKNVMFQHRPTSIHMVPYSTGGLHNLYTRIRKHKRQANLRSKGYTDEHGNFAPESGMPHLASRYRFMCIIGKGQSSILVKVQDMFQGGAIRAVKVLHTHYMRLGMQESDCLRRINVADPDHITGTLRLCNTFTFLDHYCLTFEILSPEPITYYFQELSIVEVIPAIRKVALKLLQAVGFLQQQNVIHADLKPANILLETETDLRSVKVVDFGNAIHCIHEELSLYYDDFELQTLLYRAPEVLYGLPFGLEVDMWGLGCVLAELYLNRPLFRGTDKLETLKTMTGYLGPLPQEVFGRGKFFPELSRFTMQSSERQFITTFDLMDKLECDNYAFVDFLRLLLLYNPYERLTVEQAARHPFLAPEMGLGYLMLSSGYSLVPSDHHNYARQPFIDDLRKRQYMSSRELLREGTSRPNKEALKGSHCKGKDEQENYNNNNNNSYYNSEWMASFRNMSDTSITSLHSCAPIHNPDAVSHPRARYPRSHAPVARTDDCFHLHSNRAYIPASIGQPSSQDLGRGLNGYLAAQSNGQYHQVHTALHCTTVNNRFQSKQAHTGHKPTATFVANSQTDLKKSENNGSRAVKPETKSPKRHSHVSQSQELVLDKHNSVLNNNHLSQTLCGASTDKTIRKGSVTKPKPKCNASSKPAAAKEMKTQFATSDPQIIRIAGKNGSETLTVRMKHTESSKQRINEKSKKKEVQETFDKAESLNQVKGQPTKYDLTLNGCENEKIQFESNKQNGKYISGRQKRSTVAMKASAVRIYSSSDSEDEKYEELGSLSKRKRYYGRFASNFANHDASKLNTKRPKAESDDYSSPDSDTSEPANPIINWSSSRKLMPVKARGTATKEKVITTLFQRKPPKRVMVCKPQPGQQSSTISLKSDSSDEYI